MIECPMFSSVRCGILWINCDVGVVDSVPGVHLKLELRAALAAACKFSKFLALDFFGKGVREFSGMQLHHFRAELAGGIDLFQRWIDEQAHANPGAFAVA